MLESNTFSKFTFTVSSVILLLQSVKIGELF